MDGSHASNPYLSGNFAPVRSEDDFVLEIAGEMPKGLNGAFYRNGPNPQFEPRDARHHWFAGDGMIHGVFVEDGKATYRNRYVQTPKYLVEHEAGRSLFGSFSNPASTDPSVLGKEGGVGNTNIVWHGGRLLALEEGHEPFELDPLTLASKGYRKEYAGRVTAHPKMDPETGEMVWFAYGVGAPFSDVVSYGVTDAAGTVTRRDDFQAPFSCMVHDFLVTRDHVLFPILPLTGSLERVMRGGPAFAWEPDKGSHVGVMARGADVGAMRWFTTDALYVFHPMNAWEEGSKIFADVMEYPDAPLFPNVDGSHRPNAPARLVRWTFDLADASNTIKRTPLDDLAGEFPRFDERRAGLSYRHGWFAASTDAPGALRFNALAHVDLATGKRATLEFAAGDGVGEPIFVPRSADAAEGDGWLVALLYRAAEDRSDFIVLDALDIGAGPVAAAKIPRRVPYGFHGNWRQA